MNSMMNGAMGGGWMVGWGLLVTVALVLGIAALIKYLFSKR